MFNLNEERHKFDYYLYCSKLAERETSVFSSCLIRTIKSCCLTCMNHHKIIELRAHPLDD
jgi:hypothetical protein